MGVNIRIYPFFNIIKGGENMETDKIIILVVVVIFMVGGLFLNKISSKSTDKANEKKN